MRVIALSGRSLPSPKMMAPLFPFSLTRRFVLLGKLPIRKRTEGTSDEYYYLTNGRGSRDRCRCPERHGTGRATDALPVGVSDRTSGIRAKRQENTVNYSAQGGTRTRTAVTGRGILSPLETAENPGKNGNSLPLVSHLFPPSFSLADLDSETADLLGLWQTLDDDARYQLLETARQLARGDSVSP